MSKHVLAYGSLRKGMAFHDNYFNGSELIETITLEGYSMYRNPQGNYPVIVKGQGSIVCELLKVEDQQFDRANRMEVGAGYYPVQIGVLGPDEIEATLWVYDPLAGLAPIIKGDWAEEVNKLTKGTQLWDNENEIRR